MLAYAASRPAPVERRPHPNTMLAIIAAHVAVVAVVMSAKMDLPEIIKRPPPTIFWVPTPKDPPPNPQPRRSQQQARNTSVDEIEPIVTTLPPRGEPLDPPSRLDPGTILGGANVITELPPPHSVVKLGPQLVTPAYELKPPYPASKLVTEEEATLRLRLLIDEHGRVTAVDPVGSADRIFLEAARRYLIAHWRYKAATEDGRAVASSMVITLRFQLDG